MKINCLKNMLAAADKIKSLKKYQRVRVVMYDGTRFSAIRAGADGMGVQTWNYKTGQWDSFRLNPCIIREIIFE